MLLRRLLAVIFVAAVCIGSVTSSYAQCETCTATTGQWNQSIWTCTGGATIATACEIVIPSGVTVTVTNNQGVFNANVYVGGTLTLGNQLSLGCGYNVILVGSGKIRDDASGNGSSERLIICGNTILTTGNTNGCGSCLNWPNPEGTGYTGPGSIGYPFNGTLSANAYTWNGSVSSNWQIDDNWTPSRITPSTNDALTFPSGAANQSISNIPTQTVNRILVSGGSYTFNSPASNALTVSAASPTNAFQLDNGATLNLGGANPLAVNIPNNGIASIGGSLNLESGSFAVNNGTLILHSSAATPSTLSRVNGQITIGSSATLQFGLNGASETGGTIVLPSAIFNGSTASFATIIMNRANGATLNNQTFSISSGITFTSGVLNSPNTGGLRLGSTASDPALTESASSRIVGYVETTRAPGTSALNILGFEMAAGADLGSITIRRYTGTPISFNGIQSISSYWNLTSSNFADALPAARGIQFRWLSVYDNGNNTTLPFRTYINDGAPAWSQLGSDAALTATSPLRRSAQVTTTRFNDRDFTLTDNTRTLPIELISFDAIILGTTVKLNWKTATETNNKVFSIEKLGQEGYYSIGEVAGAGNSGAETNYDFIDKAPRQGLNYYRLKQIDFDGKFSVSKVIAVDYNAESLPVLLFPNPVTGQRIFVQNLQDESTVTISSLSGRQVFKAKITVDDNALDLSNASLIPGLYVVQIQNGRQNQIQKILVK